MSIECKMTDCQSGMKELEPDSIDLIVTDPPYFLINSSGSGFMGKEWARKILNDMERRGLLYNSHPTIQLNIFRLTEFGTEQLEYLTKLKKIIDRWIYHRHKEPLLLTEGKQLGAT